MITVHFRGAVARDVVRELVDLAGDKTLVRASSHGAVVPDEVAYAYLARRVNGNGNGHAPADVLPRVEVYPVPAEVAAVVRQAEESGGLTQPSESMRRRPGRPRKTEAVKLPVGREEPTDDV